MSSDSPYLLVGNSVRYLAQSGRRAGMSMIAVDAFADADTAAAAQQVHRAHAPRPDALAECLAGVPGADALAWSYAAGFESCPDRLAVLTRARRRLLGNPADVLRVLADPARFFALLHALDIAHPQVSSVRPADSAAWLYKAAGRLGGLEVWPAAQAPRETEGYYQRRIDGELCSLLFAANGQEMHPLGFNLLAACNPARGDFRFSRAISGHVPVASPAEQMLQAARRLTRALGLRGINGLDFVLHRGQPLLLELNARPPASLELYESALPEGGLRAHMAACQGRLPAAGAISPRGLQIVYARRSCITGEIGWPRWASDRPAPGSRIDAGQPLCSVHAAADSMQAVAHLLAQHAREAIELVEHLSEVAA